MFTFSTGKKKTKHFRSSPVITIVLLTFSQTETWHEISWALSHCHNTARRNAALQGQPSSPWALNSVVFFLHWTAKHILAAWAMKDLQVPPKLLQQYFLPCFILLQALNSTTIWQPHHNLPRHQLSCTVMYHTLAAVKVVISHLHVLIPPFVKWWKYITLILTTDAEDHLCHPRATHTGKEYLSNQSSAS